MVNTAASSACVVMLSDLSVAARVGFAKAASRASASGALAIALVDAVLESDGDAVALAVEERDAVFESDGDGVVYFVTVSVHMQLHHAVKDAVRLDESDDGCETERDTDVHAEGDRDASAVEEGKAELVTVGEHVVDERRQSASTCSSSSVVVRVEVGVGDRVTVEDLLAVRPPRRRQRRKWIRD